MSTLGTEEAATEAAIRSVVASPAFQRAPTLTKLLGYLWEHRDSTVTEYALGIDVFGKRADFDPKLDATIRVHISRLRQKLKDHAAAFPDAATRLTLPSGSFRLQLEPAGDIAVVHSAPQEPGTSTPAVPPPAPPRRWPAVALGITALVLLAACVWLWRRSTAAEEALALAQTTGTSQALPPFWRRAFGNQRLTRIVFPTPVFLQTGKLRIRDVTINDADQIENSPELLSIRPLLRNYGISYSYSVTSDTLALSILMPVLAQRGLPIAVSATSELSLEKFRSENLLFLGIPPTSRHLGRLLTDAHYYVTPGSSQVNVRNPSAEESRIVALQGKRSSDRYGIISVRPGEAPGTNIVLLCGTYSMALASYLASPSTLAQLEDYLKDRGRPQYFEMIVESEMEGYNVLKARPVAFRKIAAERR